MTRRVRVTFETDEDHAETIFALLFKEVQNFSVTKVSGPRGSRYVGGRRDKGIRGRDLVIQTLATGPANHKQLKVAFRDHGFADTSLDSVLSELRQAGAVRRVGDLFTVTPKAVTA